MSMMNALSSAVSGLKVNQVGVDVVSRNIANAGTDGYTRKIAPRENILFGPQGAGVRSLPNTREVSFFLQERLRIEQSQSGRLDVLADYTREIDRMFSSADTEGSVSYAINELGVTLNALIDNPENSGVRAAVLAKADSVARHLNQYTQTVQSLRSRAEQTISAAVEEVNGALRGIEALNREIANRKTAGQSTADLEDRRDLHLRTVANNLDVRTVERTDGSFVVFSSGGQVLVSDRAVELKFDGRQQIGPENLYSTDDSERGVGTITLTSAGGNVVDLLKASPPRAGRIAGLLELRDKTLVQAQNQLDELAQKLAVGLSDRVTDLTDRDYTHTLGTPGDGDRLSLTYMTAQGPRTITAYFVEPPVTDSMSTRVPDPANTVFVDRTAADPAAALITALGTLDPAVPTGATGIVHSTVAGQITVPVGQRGLVRGMAMHSITTNLNNGPEVALFRDGNPLVGPQTAVGAQVGDQSYRQRGLAGRISVNSELQGDNLKLVTYTRDDGTDTPVGDITRPALIQQRLTETTFTFSRETALGGQGSPYQGTILDMARSMTTYQGLQATTVKELNEDQGVRTQLLEERVLSQSGVNVDDEMAQLIMLQSAYSACAKVVRSVEAMFDILMSIK